jgi:predicted enzyme related to lactoylglutathione lyase
VNLNSILIGSGDPARLVEYYARLFGPPGWDDGGYTGWQLGSGTVTVGPHSGVHGANEQPGRIIWNIETHDVRGEFARLVEAGAQVVAEPYTMEGMGDDAWIATFADPDGNYFQLMSPFDPASM